MLWEDLVIVTDLINRYGFEGPLVDFEGEASPLFPDLRSSRPAGAPSPPSSFSITQRPFTHIDSEYTTESIATIRSPLALPLYLRGKCATALYLHQLHKADDPLETTKVLQALLKPGGLLIITAPFSYPYEPQANDLWRFTPDGLRRLAMKAGLQVLDTSWHVNVTADQGFLNSRTGEPLEIRGAYAALALGGLQKRTLGKFTVPSPAPQ